MSRAKIFPEKTLWSSKHPMRWAAFLLLFASLIPGTSDAEWSPVKPTAGANASWIAKDMTLNGVPTSIVSLRMEGTVDQVASLYADRWRESGEVIERRRGRWTIIATKQKDKQFMTLQVKDGVNMVVGLLTISKEPAEHLADYEGAFRFPKAFEILSWQTHDDAAGKAETITLSLNDSVGMARSLLVGSLEGDGWESTLDRTASQMESGHVLRYVKNANEVHLTIGTSPKWSDRTLVLVVLNESSD